MVVQVEIISKEMIKPSSPTPHHLRELKFSFLDQIAMQVNIPIIFFYQADHSSDRATKYRQLKQSLSDTLVVYYPLAGRIQENSSVNCNDNGAEFVEAKVHARLFDIIENPNVEGLKLFLPLQSFSKHKLNVVLSVQASFFDCGGISVGVTLSHKIADGASLVEFVRAWAATCLGETELVAPPCFDLASQFPPRELTQLNLMTNIPGKKIVTKRLIFDRDKLRALKTAISLAPDSKLKNPTRVEAVSTFIWKLFIDAAGKQETPPIALHAVNIRSRMIPPLPDQTFGNCRLASPRITISDDDDVSENDCKDKLEMHHLAHQMRKAIKKIDVDYIKQVQNDGERYCKSLDQTMKNEMRLCRFASWCRFPVYEVDYGWGKPVWVCTTSAPCENIVVLLGTPCGEGIEAWVNILEEDTNVIGI